MIENLQTTLKSLRLGGMAEMLLVRCQEARANDLDYEEFLRQLINDELEKRRNNLINRRVKAARFPETMTLENFDFSFNTSISKKTVLMLMSTAFITKWQNVLFVGPPGVGKTHIALALGYAAVCNGHSVFYRSSFDLVADMAEAYRNGTRKEMVSKLVGYNLLIIDEFGMKCMPQNAADDLLEIVHRRYQTASTIIATNRPVADWGAILGDVPATSAILDRFLDNAELIQIKGKSFRLSKNKSIME
jgi:DNA replication protein DnaC